MNTVQSILLASDLRAPSEDAGSAALQLARATGARLTIAHVLEPLPYGPEARRAYHSYVLQQLGPLRERLAAGGVEVARPALLEGAPADSLVRMAAEARPDLLVVGAGDLSRFERFSVGPVATAVIEHAAGAVLAVRPGSPALGEGRILCAVDQSSASAEGLRWALLLARSLRLPLVVLTIVPAVTADIAAALSGRFADEQSQFESVWRGEFMQTLADSDISGVELQQEVRFGLPYREILLAARETPTSLIILGATGRSGLARMLIGSTTRRVLEQLPCSLLVARASSAAG